MELSDENDLDEFDNDEYNDLSPQIKADIEFDKNMNTIIKFKDILSREPEFIGINRISSYTIYTIIEDVLLNNNNYKINRIYINKQQYKILYNLLINLNFNVFKENDIISISNLIFNKIYV